MLCSILFDVLPCFSFYLGFVCFDVKCLLENNSFFKKTFSRKLIHFHMFGSNLENKVRKRFLMFGTHKKIIFQNIFFENVLCVCNNQLYYHTIYQKKKTILSSTKNKINKICILPNIRTAKPNIFCIIHFLMNSEDKMATNLPANSLTHLIKHKECKAKDLSPITIPSRPLLHMYIQSRTTSSTNTNNI